MSHGNEHRVSAPWPNDGGARVQTTYNGMLRRTVRARWRRCLGHCDGKWFWSSDALTHRMCHTCSPHAGDSGGEGAAAPQSETRIAEAMAAPPKPFAPMKQPMAQRAVICEGRRFASDEKAAEALGTTTHVVQAWCRTGKRGWRYEDEAPRSPERRSRKMRAVIANGLRYPSVADAARALHVHPDRIGYRIAHKWPGYSYDD